MPADLVLLTQDDAETKPDITKFQSLCGSLNHIACTTQPDISFSVSTLCQHMANPSHTHYKQALRVLAYLWTTRDQGPTYDKSYNHPFNGRLLRR